MVPVKISPLPNSVGALGVVGGSMLNKVVSKTAVSILLSIAVPFQISDGLLFIANAVADLAAKSTSPTDAVVNHDEKIILSLSTPTCSNAVSVA